MEGQAMAQRSKTAELTANPQPGGEEEMPDWAKPSHERGQTETQAPIAGQIVSGTPALDNLLEWLVSEAATDSESAMGMEAIVRQALAAENMAQVLTQIMPISAGDFVGVPMFLSDFTIRESEFEGEHNLPYYASLDVLMGEPPQPRVVNTGSIKILAQLKRLQELDALPCVVMVTEAAKAKQGRNAPLGLTQVDGDA
jgi:hypothetical protein